MTSRRSPARRLRSSPASSNGQRTRTRSGVSGTTSALPADQPGHLTPNVEHAGAGQVFDLGGRVSERPLERRAPHGLREGEVGAEEVEVAHERSFSPSGSKKGRRRTRAFSKEPFTLIVSSLSSSARAGGTQAMPIARPR